MKLPQTLFPLRGYVGLCHETGKVFMMVKPRYFKEGKILFFRTDASGDEIRLRTLTMMECNEALLVKGILDDGCLCHFTILPLTVRTYNDFIRPLKKGSPRVTTMVELHQHIQ